MNLRQQGYGSTAISGLTGYINTYITKLTGFKTWENYLAYKEKLSQQQREKYQPKVAVLEPPISAEEAKEPEPSVVSYKGQDSTPAMLIRLITDYNNGLSQKELFGKYGDYAYRIRMLKSAIRSEEEFEGVRINDSYKQAAAYFKEHNISLSNRKPVYRKKYASAEFVAPPPTQPVDNASKIFDALDNLLEAIDLYVATEIDRRLDVIKKEMLTQDNPSLVEAAKRSNWINWLAKRFGSKVHEE